MKLEEYLKIFKIKPKELAKSLKVSRQAVYDWISGKSIPRAKMAAEIVRLTCGKVSYEDIYSSDRKIEKKDEA